MKNSAKKKSSSGIDGARDEGSFRRGCLAEVESSDTLTRSQSDTALQAKFGDIQFPNGLMTRFCIVGPNSKPDLFCEMVLQHADMWFLDCPRLLLSIMGGADYMNLDPVVESHFCEGLVGAAKQTCGWVITGGTDSGVMDLVGRAMHKHDPRRTVPCIGMVPFGACKKKWQEELEREDLVDSSETIIVEAPKKEDLTGDKLAGLQQHHTHLILVDSGARGGCAFGTELNFRETLEQYIAKNLKHVSSEGKFQHQQSVIRTRSDSSNLTATLATSDRVMIVVNGGAGTFQAMSNAIKSDNSKSVACPVVVCDGSGRAADFVAALKLGRITSYEEAWTTHMTADADKKNGMKPFYDRLDMLKEIVESPCVTVYTVEDRLEEVILRAVYLQVLSKAEQNKDNNKNTLREGLQRCLELAMQWKCVQHYAQISNKLVKNDMSTAGDGVEAGLKWMLTQLVNDWRELDCGPLMKWIVETHVSDLKQMDVGTLTPEGLEWSAMDWHKLFKRSNESNQNGLLMRGNSSLPQRGTLAYLYIWLVENQASMSAVDVIWMELDYPAHGALAAASAYREVADRLQSNGGYGDTLEKQRLLALADRSEDLAIRLLAGLDRFDTLEYLFRRAARYSDYHLISLAHHLKCKEFVSQQFYNTAVDNLWATPTPFAVFAFDNNVERRRRNLVTHPFTEIPSLMLKSSQERVALRDLFSVPRIKAFTHGSSRLLFILLYSYYVLFAEGWFHAALSLLLFVWGISLSLVEILQIQAKNSFKEYLNVWNFLDLLVLVLLLGSLLCSSLLTPLGLVTEKTAMTAHALNLLPCYLRLLQIFELSEYFGVLLFTVFGMAQDTFHFLVLLGIISLGFSCSLTPIFFPTVEERWESGVTWGFWAIFGDVSIESSDKSLTWERHMIIGFLKYMLSLTSSVLLVNLLIAMLNDTYIANKDASKREWAFNRVDAVLEFSSPEAHIMPPPLDILVSMRSLVGSSHPISRRTSDDFCTVTKVVPVSSSEVEVYFKVQKINGDLQKQADESIIFCEGEEPKTADHANLHTATEGKIVFRGVVLTSPLQLRFGREEDGYKPVKIVLSEDTWRRPLTSLERRQVKALQQQVLNDEREQRAEEKTEHAAMVNFDEKLRRVNEEMVRMREQVGELVAEKRSERSDSKVRTDLAAENEQLRAEVERLKATLDALSSAPQG